MSISGDSNGNGNGSDRGSWNPDAVAELVAVTAAKQSADEAWIKRVDENVAEIAGSLGSFQRGETQWQKDTTARLTVISNQVLALSAFNFAAPKVVTIAACFLGGFSAVMTALLFKLIVN